MAKSREFQSINTTIFGPVSDIFIGVMHKYLDLVALYRFLLTSRECYQLAINEFRKRYHQLFLTSVVTRNDVRTFAMLKSDPSLYEVCMRVEDYSFRRFMLPAFTYYLFTWDQAGLELMINAIAPASSTHESAQALVEQLLEQLAAWKKFGVTYKLPDGDMVTEYYYDPTSLCDEMSIYELNEEIWDDNHCEEFIANKIFPLQSLLPVHLLYAMGARKESDLSGPSGELNSKGFGSFHNRIFARLQPQLHEWNLPPQFQCIYPQHSEGGKFVITRSIAGACVSSRPHGGAVAAVSDFIEDRYKARVAVVEEIEKKLIGYKNNPATLFAADAAPEPKQKKQNALPRPVLAFF